jgi:hypothetical protein
MPDASSKLSGVAVQREPISDDKVTPASDVPTVATDSDAAVNTTKDKGKSVNLTLTALYEDVPGEAKDKVKRADGDDALWFDPLTMLSNHPITKRSKESAGIVAGGQKTVDTFAAPVTESGNPVGRGSISAELKYASERNKSFNVTVSGLSKKDTRKAEAIARAFIQKEIRTFGDVDEIATLAENELVQTYPGAKVSIATVKNKVMDAGQSTFFYKVHNDAGILMEVQVAPVGEKQTKYSGSKTTGGATEDETSKKDKTETEKVDVKDVVKDTEQKTEKSKESVEVQYNEAVVRTLEDYVTKATTVHNKFASELATKVVKDKTYNKDEVWKKHDSSSAIEDYTKNVESGKKDKENWAAKLKKGIDGVKKVTSIPYVDKIPGIGWITRRVKGWQLDLAGWVADQFAERGQVNYEDTKIHKETTTNGDSDVDSNVDIKAHDEEETKRKLSEDYQSKTKDEWERHLKDVTTISKQYKSLTEKESVGTADKTHTEDYSKTTKKEESETEQRHKDTGHKTTTTTFEVSNTWKYTKPVINARVVSGDAEVNNIPFSPEADETTTKE